MLTTLPSTIKEAELPRPDFSKIGFRWYEVSTPKTSDWKYWAIAISLPSSQTWELFDTFCALKGATEKPKSWSIFAITKVMVDFPASLLVPKIEMLFIY